MIDIGEPAGSGFNTIYTIWEKIGWQTPSLLEKYDPERTTVTIYVEHEEKKNRRKHIQTQSQRIA